MTGTLHALAQLLEVTSPSSATYSAGPMQSALCAKLNAAPAIQTARIEVHSYTVPPSAGRFCAGLVAGAQLQRNAEPMIPLAHSYARRTSGVTVSLNSPDAKRHGITP